MSDICGDCGRVKSETTTYHCRTCVAELYARIALLEAALVAADIAFDRLKYGETAGTITECVDACNAYDAARAKTKEKI